MNKVNFKLDWLILPMIGALLVILAWSITSSTISKGLPSPSKTWSQSKLYVEKPFEKRGEMDLRRPAAGAQGLAVRAARGTDRGRSLARAGPNRGELASIERDQPSPHLLGRLTQSALARMDEADTVESFESD